MKIDKDVAKIVEIELRRFSGENTTRSVIMILQGSAVTGAARREWPLWPLWPWP